MDFESIKSITIPEGEVVEITYDGVVLWSAGRIPGEYQEVEWIQADAGVGAYINLGFSYDIGATIYLGQWVMNHNTAYPFGAAENSGKLRCMFSIPYSNDATAYYSKATNYQATAVGYSINIRNDFMAIFKDSKFVWTNLTKGDSQESDELASYTMSNNLYLFAQNYNGNPRFGDIRRISYFKYYDKTDTLICDLVPCYRRSDGVIGMYDIVSNKFFTNIGIGSFTKGPDADIIKNYTNLIPLSTEADGKTIYNGGLGYKNSYRVRSGGAEAASDNSVCTGFIPFIKGDKLYIYPPFTGQNINNAINFYDSSYEVLGQVTDSGAGYGICNPNVAPFKTTLGNGVSVLDLSNNTISGVENIAFVRITNDKYQMGGSGMIITKNEEIDL